MIMRKYGIEILFKDKKKYKNCLNYILNEDTG